ncbi:MAG: N-acetylmuramoyl-L-alanine amidase [Acidaminobacteraceae bacterium]
MSKNRFKKVASLFVVLCIISSMSIGMAFATSTSDLSNHWAKTTIESWMDQGLTSGYPDGSFKPDNNITRAEFMTLVNKAFGYTKTAKITYPDVEASKWYYNSVTVAKAAGYISGYPDGTMKPQDPISREEAAAIITRIKSLVANDEAANIFTDYDKLTWSKGAVGAITDANIMNGYSNLSFGPQKLIKRGECVVSLDRASKFIGPSELVPSDVATINSVEVVKGSTDAQRIKISSDKVLKFETSFLPTSNKLVIDIIESKLTTSKGDKPTEIIVNDVNFNNVSYSQYKNSPYTTRIVVTMTDKYDYNIVTSNDGKISYITLNEHQVKDIYIDDIDGKKAIVIDNISNVKYNIMKLNSPERIVIDLMDSAFLGNTTYDLQLGFIKGIRASQFTESTNYNSSDRIARIVLDVIDGVSNPNIIIDNDKDRLIIFLEKIVAKPILKPSDRTIVIDPGHGGSDPGAISPNGTKEKDVNLNLALKSESYLKSLDYNVVMTRNTDIYVNLYERAEIANRENADMFISIHHNSYSDRSIYGLEILYCPIYNGIAKTEDQYPLAKVLNETIIDNTGANDRGIKQRPNLVVIRETNMVSVLLEIGYLSNSEEEAQILSDEYQNKVVQGIVDGIQKYFELY